MIINNIDGKIYLALKSLLNNWYETNIHYPYENNNPSADQAFLIVDPVNIDFGDTNLSYTCGEEHRGFWNIRVMTPLGWTYEASSGLVGRLAHLMRSNTKISYEDANVLLYRQPQSMGSPQLEISWNRQDIRVFWRCWG